ncbi:hypothetical protein PHLCEN_2v4688 [Hermanssonia centrifuga]|uniref:Uncharacterized protein n=1 Tax=Hermanssonia centrifuga TaxID=98765 RepID=A0A2R6PN24_9APHY|nr:hypothetical protein PHLCEN_2v4688 [Hermanssonia centrifuga]
MLFTLSITLSSPLLALNILLRSPLPIPSGLFDSPADPPSVVMRAPSPLSLAPSYAHSYKRSGSVTVVEGRRSGDVWISNGDAVEGKSKFGRAVGLLQPKPKLAVLPSGCEYYGPPLTPPLPIQDPEAEEHERTVPSTPQSVNNAELGVGMHHPEVLAKEDRGDDDNHVEMGMRKKDSKASSYWSGTDENVAFATKIMVAQKHYSTLAMTMVLPPSPQRRGSQEVNPGAQTAATTTAVAAGAESAAGKRASGSNHLRARSVSSMSPISAPPSSPLPPTPPTIKTMLKLTAAQSYRARTTSQASGGNPHNHNRGHGKLTHRRSYSSISSFPDLGLSEPAAELGGFINHHNNDYSFGPIDHDSLNEIDALSAGLLPLLVPGLKVGGEMRITESWKKAPSTTTTRFGNYQMGGRRNLGADAEVPEELGGMVSSDFESPQMHSTPHTRKANTQTPRTKKTSAHKRHHFSLPSLSLGKDGIHALSTWRNDLNKALETKGTSTSQYSAVPTLNVASDDVSSDRRNTVLGSDFISQLHLNAVREDDELAFSSRPAAAAAVVVVDHRYSTGFKSDTLDVPEGISTARNSMATLISALDQELNMPPGASASVPTVWQGVVPSSAASDVTLFEFNPSVEGLAESTPYDSNKVLPMGGSGRSRSGEDRAPPPVPEIPKAVKASRRSSIVYIKSDSTTATTGPIITGTSSSLSNKNNNDTSLVVSPKGGLAGWSSRAVAPLMPKSKASKLQLKASKMSRRSENDPDSAQAEAAPAVRELRMGGLRPLSLLQDRQNTANAAAAGGGVETRPLKLGKGSSKSSRASARSSDENEPPRTRESSFKKSLRPLKLARNETTKQRAVLREREVLPDVVVRPPSNGHHVGYAYDFRS